MKKHKKRKLKFMNKAKWIFITKDNEPKEKCLCAFAGPTQYLGGGEHKCSKSLTPYQLGVFDGKYFNGIGGEKRLPSQIIAYIPFEDFHGIRHAKYKRLECDMLEAKKNLIQKEKEFDEYYAKEYGFKKDKDELYKEKIN